MYADEIRVAIVNNGVVEDLEYQASKKKTTKGNIYLAKVTRVEPSLQAAFVDYGSGKHGFLPFSEIHPDYYQIPTADKEQLLEEIRNNKRSRRSKEEAPKQEEGNVSAEAEGEENTPQDDVTAINTPSVEHFDDEGNDRQDFYKRYRIQEVIKKDQVMLVQIEKEERGNKGAALTSYISIAGRYCVYIPNSTKGGGVSRKISDAKDRDRLKDIARELTDEMDGAGAIIVRTAGAYKTKADIKRDASYLQSLWNNIREHTVKSNAPTFIHEEGDVIKKAIRDMYDASIDEIRIQGDDAFKDAREFMKLIMPKHVNKVVKHDSRNSLFSQFNVEEQIAELYGNQVCLKSGGYLVINQTEALVAIDVNSGRATSERNVESTAARTNIEAAKEVARQIKLRDLSGLIVIDFIDMEDSKNRKSVEKVLKDALASDKAKIQLSRISPFGLLEMSRQRIRQSFADSNTQVCEHCQGRGRIRHIDATSFAVLRAIENEMAEMQNGGEITVFGSANLISCLLNNKRSDIAKLDAKFKGKIIFLIDESAGGDGFFIERKKAPKDISVKEPLSTIDDADIAIPEPQAQEKRFKVKKGKFKMKKRHDADSKESAEEFEEAMVSESHNEMAVSEAPDMDNVQEENRGGGHRNNKSSKRHRNQKRRKGGHKNPMMDGNGNTSSQPMHDSDSDEADKFESEMAARRKANQSLLKEIWKKIVD